MNWLVKWGVKKYVLGIVNTALKDNEQSVIKARQTVGRYVAKATAFLGFLNALDQKLADNVVDNAEADELVSEAVKLGETLTSK